MRCRFGTCSAAELGTAPQLGRGLADTVAAMPTRRNNFLREASTGHLRESVAAGVVSGPTVVVVATGVAVEQVIAALPVEVVSLGAAVDPVVASRSLNVILAVATVDYVLARVPEDEVVVRRADHILDVHDQVGTGSVGDSA